MIEKSDQYRQAPVLLDGEFTVEPTEMFAYQYLPIKMAGEGYCTIEERLRFLEPIIQECLVDFSLTAKADLIDQYIYLSAKNLFITKGTNLNRLGWHSDGFLSDDINYVWCNAVPTVWNKSEFLITPDHSLSLAEFQEQADPWNDVEIPVNRIARLNQFVVHRPGVAEETVCRMFVKVSFSKEKYNLIGNSHNYLLDYNWEMKHRNAERNHPMKK